MTRDAGGWKAQFVMVKGRAIHIECVGGGDE